LEWALGGLDLAQEAAKAEKAAAANEKRPPHSVARSLPIGRRLCQWERLGRNNNNNNNNKTKDDRHWPAEYQRPATAFIITSLSSSHSSLSLFSFFLLVRLPNVER